MNGTSRTPATAGALLLGLLACQPRDSDKNARAEPARPAPSATNAPPQAPAAPARPAAPGPAASDPPSAERPSAKEVRKLLSTQLPEDQVQRVVNPSGRAPYAGPVGTVVGTLRAKGDPPFVEKDVLAAVEADCTRAKGTFGRTPREGPGRTLADVLVAVTEYDGYVPVATADRPVVAEGCAWDSRTIAVTFGQTLTITAGDSRAYVPDLLGQTMPAQLFVMPGAEPVRLPPRKPGRYRLVDSMRLYSAADVFVVPYATVDVTGLDGRFEIGGIPAGKVKVSALLPATMEVEEREVVVPAGGSVSVDFSLAFDRKLYEKLRVELPQPTKK